MLSKIECVQAIKKWETVRCEYLKVEKLINPTFAFNFSQKNCDWLNKNNDNSMFHTYIGVHDGKLILIVVPLDKNGKEIDLPNYLTSTLSPLKNDIILEEVDVTTTIKKTTLSKNLEVTKYSEENLLPIYNEPIIPERASLYDIEKWKNECLDWFYCECNDFKGKRIFRSFTVPFTNIAINDEKHDKVKAMFGFKNSSIYKRQIPVLIFVRIESHSSNAEIICSDSISTESETNTKDYSQPCPPYCRNSLNFKIFN